MKLIHLLNGLPKKNVKEVVSGSDITLVDICAFSGNAPSTEKISEESSFEKLIDHTSPIVSTIDLINWQQENVFNNDNVYLIPRSKVELERFSKKLDDAYQWRCKVKEAIESIKNSLNHDDNSNDNMDHENFLNVLYEYVSTVKGLNNFFENKIYGVDESIIKTSVDASKADHAIVGSAVGYSERENKESVILTRDIDVPKIFIDYLRSVNDADKVMEKVGVYFVDKAGKECWHFDPREFNGRAKSFIWSLEKSSARVPVYKK